MKVIVSSHSNKSYRISLIYCKRGKYLKNTSNDFSSIEGIKKPEEATGEDHLQQAD